MGLLSIPIELLHFLCLFLSEDDITSLSQTCLGLFHRLNYNNVWKRFVTKLVKSLDGRDQLLNPVHPDDPSLCENRQHTARKNHLISNWRNLRFTQSVVEHGVEVLGFSYSHSERTISFYNDNYVLFRTENLIQFWDISKIKPVLHHSMEVDGFRLLLGGRMVDKKGCRIDIYEINIEEKKFPPLYSFAVVEDQVVRGIVPHERGDRCKIWEIHGRGNLICFNEKSWERFPELHIWDIESACKVGVFVSPVRCKYLRLHSTENNLWFFVAVGNSQMTADSLFVRFDTSKKCFSENTFKIEFYDDYDILFYADHCIKMKKTTPWNGRESPVMVEVFEFDTSMKVKERIFDHARFKWQYNEVFGDKLVILSTECFYVINALSLETVETISHGSGVHSLLCATSVFGSVFFITAEGAENTVKMWDVEKRTSTEIPPEKFSKSMVDHICHIYQNRGRGLFCPGCCIVQGKEPITSFVTFEVKEIFITHFW